MSTYFSVAAVRNSEPPFFTKVEPASCGTPTPPSLWQCQFVPEAKLHTAEITHTHIHTLALTCITCGGGPLRLCSPSCLRFGSTDPSAPWQVNRVVLVENTPPTKAPQCIGPAAAACSSGDTCPAAELAPAPCGEPSHGPNMPTDTVSTSSAAGRAAEPRPRPPVRDATAAPTVPVAARSAAAAAAAASKVENGPLPPAPALPPDGRRTGACTAAAVAVAAVAAAAAAGGCACRLA